MQRFNNINRCVYPLLGNGLANTFPQQTHSTIGHLLLGNGPVKHAFLTADDGVYRGVSAEELQKDTVRRRARLYKEYRTVVESSQVFGIIGCRNDNDNDKPIKSLLKGKGLLPPVGLARLDS
jgi:hypothetical protein